MIRTNRILTSGPLLPTSSFKKPTSCLSNIVANSRVRPFASTRTTHRSSAMADTEPTSAQPVKPDVAPTQDLPKLSTSEFRAYNRMAAIMEQYHNHFRQAWQLLHSAAVAERKPAGMTLRQFLNTAAQFCHQLNLHHNIEETQIFPVLAERMPAFQKELHLLTQHKAIHAGLERLEEYVAECRSGERELRWPELLEIMNGFGEVLWAHLDDEVVQLGAENMRKYWTIREVEQMH